MQKIRSKSSNEITCNFHGLHKAVTENDKQNLCEQRQFQGIQRSNLMDQFLIEIQLRKLKNIIVMKIIKK